MGIGGVTSSNSMSVMQMTTAGTPDAKSKKIQDEITNVEREMQKISSDAELSYTEKTDEKKTLQKEISSLSTKLDQRQEELLRSQKRESMLAELREDQKPEKAEDEADDLQAKEAASDTAAEANKTPAADESQTQPQAGAVIASTDDGTVILKEDAKPIETQGIVSETEQAAETKEKDVVEEDTKEADNDTDTNVRPSGEEMRAMVSADTSAQLAGRQGTIISKTEDGIAILKGEIAQDERRGVNTERKQAELEKMEKQQERATAFQFSVLGNAMNSAAETNAAGIEKTAQDDTENNAYTTAIRASQEDQAIQQQFQVSIA
ncbi:MAG: hypothetical protein HDR07_00255 [Lachnospiraceae bacterium]|nr:hypothetical protein [Lachnospiraceae bacterium]